MKKILWIVCLVLSSIQPLAAQQAQTITMTIDEGGYDGTASQLGWTPVVVTLANSGSDVQGVLSISARFSANDSGTYSQVVDLPGGSVKQIEIPFGGFQNTSDIRVQFVIEGKIIAREDYTIQWQNPETFIIGAFGGAPATLAGFNIERVPTKITAALSPEFFPETDAELLSFNMLVVSDVPTSPEQIAAVKRWVAAGGILWYDLSPIQSRITESWGDILPMSEFDSTSRPAELQLNPQNATKTYPMQVRTLNPNDNTEILLRDPANNEAVLIRQRLGRGAILVAGFDLGQLPIDLTTKSLLNSFIDAPSVGVLNPQPSTFSSNNNSNLPSPSIFALILFLYIVIIGPINYFILKRLDRREWAWFSIPIIVVVFAGIAYIAGAPLRTSSLFDDQISVIESAPGMSEGRLTTAHTLSAGRRNSWDISVPSAVTVGDPRSNLQWNMSYDQDYQQQLDGSTLLDDWSFATSQTRGLIGVGSVAVPYSIKVSFDYDSRGVITGGTLTNTGNQDITNAILSLGSMRMISLPELAAGESYEFEASQALTDNFDLPGMDWQVTNSLRDMYQQWDNQGNSVATPLNTTPHILIATEEVLMPLTSEGKTLSTNGLSAYIIYLQGER